MDIQRRQVKSVTPFLENLKEYSTRNRIRTRGLPQRSANPEYPEIHKFQDVTLFNAANNMVCSYRNYPNRQQTPLRSPHRNYRQERRILKTASPRERYVQNLMRNSGPISSTIRRTLFKQAIEAPIRSDASPPKVVQHIAARPHFVINDYHNKESNPGYSRNEFGGRFFTR